MTPPELVDVWRVDLRVVAQRVSPLDGSLSDDERNRAARFRSNLHRTRWTAYRTALRIILASYLNIVPPKIAFTAGRYGKPRVAGPEQLTFNGSHSGDLALVAVARGFEIGIDVEMVRPLADVDAVGRRVFSARDAAAIGALAGDAKLRTFYACWTRKEAVAKALGLSVFTAAAEIRAHADPTVVDLSCDEAAGALAACCEQPSVRKFDFRVPLVY